MIYGIEDTTDLRYPETKIEKFRSVAQALEWASHGGLFAWPGAASHLIPGPQQNFHHRLRKAYKMPTGWRPPGRREQDAYMERNRDSRYHRTADDFVAECIREHGERLYAPERTEAP
jgi:hypothetical protein